MKFFVIALSLAASACATSESQATCPASVDRAQLHLDYDAFDAAGWRDLLSGGCTDSALALLSAYRDANAGRLQAAQTREINFHMGQSLALSGRDSESIAHFEHARGGEASEEWSAYVEATLAFLRRDKAALAAQRERYAAAPGADPRRLSFIDGFVACPTQPYVEAVHCGMRASH